jgi:mannose-6-phosphate isomerase-like protein (cupin superfamily)
MMKKSLTHALAGLKYLPNRTPEMSLTDEGAHAFAAVAPYREGAVYVGHYSGSSEWERHAQGDELVMALAGTTTVILLHEGGQEHIALAAHELVVVPAGVWHRFEGSNSLKVMTVTPQPTDHSIELPEH